MTQEIKAGDFSGLASDYSQYRPNYSASVLNAILGIFEKTAADIDFIDVGAGTGIWTRMVFSKGVKSATAVEPNDDMRKNGERDSRETSIRWFSGSAEQTGLPASSCDWVTMASSFHWADFDFATKEFHRLLRPQGFFTALWNPRMIEVNPLLVEIEAYLKTLKPDVKRVSSGRSGITENLSDRLFASPFFEDVVYIEGRHIICMTQERYIGAWRSVNDLQSQLGRDNFNRFLEFVQRKIENLQTIEATYLTRSWTARRKD